MPTRVRQERQSIRQSKDGKNQRLGAPFREVSILQVFTAVGYPWFKCTTFEFQLLQEVRRRRPYHPAWDWSISTQRHRRGSGYIFGKNSEGVWKYPVLTWEKSSPPYSGMRRLSLHLPLCLPPNPLAGNQVPNHKALTVQSGP